MVLENKVVYSILKTLILFVFKVELDGQLESLKAAQEEIHHSHMEQIKVELQEEKKLAVQQLQEVLEKRHKDELNTLEGEWTTKLHEAQERYYTTLQTKTGMTRFYH